MFKRREKNGDARIDTLIGKSASVQGDVEFSGGLHIDGHITGSVRAIQGAPAALSVSEHGVIDGSVEAPSVVLNGRVNGDIFGSERVILGAKAQLRPSLMLILVAMLGMVPAATATGIGSDIQRPLATVVVGGLLSTLLLTLLVLPSLYYLTARKGDQ